MMFFRDLPHLCSAVSEFFLLNLGLFKPVLECGFIGVLSAFYIGQFTLFSTKFLSLPDF